MRRTVTLTGAWSLKEQTFADGRLSLYNRETGTWKFFTADLEETGFMTTENMDEYFSYDGDTYYYLNDHVLCRKSVADGIQEEVPLNIQLRFLDITAFDGKSGRMALHFYLSPYGSECGTAILNVTTGQLDVLQTEYSQTVFTEKGMCLLTFENDAMGYSLRCGSEDKGYYFVDAGIFLDRGNDLYAVPNSPYLIGTGRGSTLYMPGEKIRAWFLADLGLSEDVYFSCFLPEKAVLLMAVFRDGAFHIYAMKPEDISFEELAEGAPIPSPLVVEEALAQSYWQQANGIPTRTGIVRGGQKVCGCFGANLRSAYPFVLSMQGSGCSLRIPYCADGDHGREGATCLHTKSTGSIAADAGTVSGGISG